MYSDVQWRMATIGVTELRANLRDVLERVKRGEDVIVTQNDEPVAAMLHPSKVRLRVRTANTEAADALLERLAEARREQPERGRGISLERAESMVEELRSDRDSWR